MHLRIQRVDLAGVAVVDAAGSVRVSKHRVSKPKVTVSKHWRLGGSGTVRALLSRLLLCHKLNIPSKGVVVLAVGLPGSGKSSWFKRHSISPLSSDVLRSMLFDDPAEQRFQDLVFSNLRSMLKARLIARRPTNYVDATNLTPNERHNWVKLAKDFGYEAHAVFFDVPLQVCIERHQRRDRTVPEDVMRKMSAKLKAPTFDEGFAKITVVRVKAEGSVVPASGFKVSVGSKAEVRMQIAELTSGGKQHWNSTF